VDTTPIDKKQKLHTKTIILLKAMIAILRQLFIHATKFSTKVPLAYLCIKIFTECTGDSGQGKPNSIKSR